MEAAKIKQPLANSVEFEELFAESCQPDSSLTANQDQTDIIQASVTEAAKLLEITERTIWRRIRQKKLNATLVDGKTIIRLRQTDIPIRQSDKRSDIERVEAHPVSDTSDNVTDSQSDITETESAIELIAELAAKLEAATYRNGYLEAVLKNQSDQIQLLPDLQAQARKKEMLEQEVADLRAQANKVTELESVLTEKNNEIIQLRETLTANEKKGWLNSVASWFKGQPEK